MTQESYPYVHLNNMVNNAMEGVLDCLVAEGVVTKKQSDYFLNTHLAVVAESDGFLRRWWKKTFKTTNSTDSLSMVLILKHNYNIEGGTNVSDEIKSD